METAVEVEDLAGDETRERMQEEAHAMGELFRLAEAADRNLLEQRLALLLRELLLDQGVRT